MSEAIKKNNSILFEYNDKLRHGIVDEVLEIRADGHLTLRVFVTDEACYRSFRLGKIQNLVTVG